MTETTKRYAEALELFEEAALKKAHADMAYEKARKELSLAKDELNAHELDVKSAQYGR